MLTINASQGSDIWHSHRAQSRNASEAPALMGVSKYMTRNELLKQKATGIAPDVDAATQARFDRGHQTEEMARCIVEEMIADELYPIVGQTDDGYLSASFDGVNMEGTLGFEHKLFNVQLAQAVRDKDLPPAYYWQLEQQILVGSLEKIIFVCSDGTKDNFESMEYRAVPGRAEQLIAAWSQFDQDLADYKPKELSEKPKAAAILSLPALSVQIKGEVTLSNLPMFIAAADTFLDGINTELTTDQHFSDAEANIKACDTAEKGIEQAKNAITAQVSDIDQVLRTMDLYKDKLRNVRLTLDKLVKTQKEVIKTGILSAAKLAFTEHVAGLEAETKPIRLIHAQPDFGGAAKNKRTLASLHDAVDTELANAKIATNATATDVRAKLAWCKTNADGYQFLFMDMQQIIQKQSDDFQLLVTSRIADHKRIEAEKLEAERKRIQIEEEAKAAAKVKAEQAAAQKLIDDAAHAALMAESLRIDKASRELAAAQRLESAIVPVEAVAAPSDQMITTIPELNEFLAAKNEAIRKLETETVAATAVEMVTITKAEYDQLLKDSDWLACLEAAGVDNWPGFDDAREIQQQAA